jgi:hypothetical protein
MVEGACLRADFAMGINLGLVPSVRKVSIIRTVIKPGLGLLTAIRFFFQRAFRASRNLLDRDPPPRIHGRQQLRAIDKAWGKWVVLIAGATSSVLRDLRPPDLHITLGI